jgi:predicted  nucleic acid-binding Zn-ribbon protein
VATNTGNNGHSCRCSRTAHTGPHNCTWCGASWPDNDDYPIVGEQPACELEALRAKVAELTALNDQLQDTQAEMLAQTDHDIVSAATCSCGSVIEIRDSQISVTAEEKAATAALLNAGRAAMYRFSPEGAEWIVGRVIDAINATRTRDDHDAMRDWQDAHAECGQSC